MADFSMTRKLNLTETVRNGIPAVRRTIICSSTSQQDYGPEELIYIPISTGASGSFFNTDTSTLNFTFVVRNKNLYTDFFNLSRNGMHACIQEFGVEINNVYHEQKRHYSEIVEAVMIRNGENMRPFEMVRSNPYEVGGGTAGVMHINFIKPSMVDNVGLPHGVIYDPIVQPVGSTVTASTSDNLSQGYILQANPFLHMALGRRGYDAVGVTFSGTYPTVQNTTSGGLEKSFSWWASSSFPGMSWGDDRIYKTEDALGSYKRCNTNANSTYNASNITANTWGNVSLANSAVAETSGSTYALDTQHFSSHRFVGTPSGGDMCGYYSKLHACSKGYGYTNSDNTIFDVDFGQTVGGYTPIMWPAKQPCDLEKLQQEVTEALYRVNTENIQNYYANCKNIPCSIPVALTGDSYGETAIWGDSLHTIPTIPSDGYEYRFQVKLEIYSSILGTFCKKWFPSLLIPADRMRIRIRLASASSFFQHLMDPCRKVPGTARDVYPYLGVFDTSSNTVAELTSCSYSALASHIHPIMISNYSPGDVFNDLIATGRYPVPQMVMKEMHQLQTMHHVDESVYDTGSSKWIHPSLGDSVNFPHGTVVNTAFTSHIYDVQRVNFQYLHLEDSGETFTDSDTSFAKFLTAKNVAPTSYTEAYAFSNAIDNAILNLMRRMEFERYKNQKVGFPICAFSTGVTNGISPGFQTSLTVTRDTTPSTIGKLQNYFHENDWTNLFSYDGYGDRRPGGVGAAQQIFHSSQTGTTPPPNDHIAQGLNWNPFCFPTPQYVPIIDPSDKRTTRKLNKDAFVDESYVCFGTHLRRSKAQVRRSHGSLYSLNVPYNRAHGLYENLTFRVQNINYTVEEIILPRQAAIGIIENALEGGIAIETKGVKDIESILPKADTVKHLINMSAAFANDMMLLFRPTETFSGGKAIGYNSRSFYCPYAAVKMATQSTGTKDVNTAGDSDLKKNKAAPSSATEYNNLGGDLVMYNQLRMGARIGINLQVQIANEYIPRVPIDDLNTLIEQTKWGDQVFVKREYLDLGNRYHFPYDVDNAAQINVIQDGHWGAFVPIECLDDQTITCNPYFTPLEMSISTMLRGKRAKSGCLPLYKSPDASFHLSFNFEAFMGQQNEMRTGVPVVNNNMYFISNGLHMCREYETQLLTLVFCDMKLVIERGGVTQLFS